MNPIIETVDAGHQQHGTTCEKCKVPYPCPAILQARKDNVSYVPIPDLLPPGLSR